MTKRPVVKVRSTGQLSLLHQPAVSGPQASAVRKGPSFVDPDPEAIWLGDRSLRTHLEASGYEWVPALRGVIRSLDLGALESKYNAQGRPGYAPALMLSLILYGVMKGMSSLRQLEELARVDLVAMYLTGGACPDHATIGRFICLHSEQIDGPLFEQLTRAIFDHAPGEPDRTVSVDGTVMESAASRYRALKKEAAQRYIEKAKQEHDDDPDDPDATRKRAKAERLEEALKERVQTRAKGGHGKAEDTRVSLTDPDAVFHKFKGGRGFGFGYIVSLIANRDRFVVSYAVEQSDEARSLPYQLEQVERVLGAPDRLLADSNYFRADVLQLAVTRGLDLVVPPPETRQKKRPTLFPKHRFEHHPELDVLECPAGEFLTPRSAGHDERAGQDYVFYQTPACDGCELRNLCTTAVRGRRIKRYESDTLLEAGREVYAQLRARESYAARACSVEPAIGEFRHLQGLQRFLGFGLRQVRVETALHAMAHNLRRLVAICRRSRLVSSILSLFASFWTLLAIPQFPTEPTPPIHALP